MIQPKTKGGNSGFTLIELVVVMAIIAILTSLSVYNFAQARAKARDISRKNDLKQYANALEAYKADHTAYPGDLPTLKNSGYVNVTYTDPKEKAAAGSWTNYTYTPNAADSLKFTLEACLENKADPDRVVGSSCANSAGVVYRITEP